MVRKDYNSVIYIAEELAHCVRAERNYKHKQGVTGWRAEHHGDRVDINFAGQWYEVQFKSEADKTLFGIVEKGENEYFYSGKFKIRRSKFGRISPPSLTEFLEKRIISPIKRHARSKE